MAAKRERAAPPRKRRPRPKNPGDTADSQPALSCAAAFRSIAQTCLAEISANQPGARAGQADAIHRMRIAITRLRAAASFFSPMTSDETWPQLKNELRWLNRSLGSARDVDVVAENLRHQRYRKLATNGIEADLEQRSLQSRKQLNQALGSPRLTSFIAAASQWLESGPWATRSDRRSSRQRSQPVGPHAEKTIARWRQKLIRRGSALADMNEGRRHRLRIRAKRLRYMLEALATICPERSLQPFGKLKRPIRSLQRSLGDLGDLKRLRRWTAASMHEDVHHVGPHRYKREKKLALADAVKAYRKIAHSTVQ
jgi:CHAD domain-containing protein